MQINAMPPWAHPQRGESSLPSYTKDNSGYTPYVNKGKIFGLTHNSQVAIMFIETKKDTLGNTLSPSGSQPWAFNSAGMMTKSQLVASTRTPRAPSRGLPTTGRGLITSPIMFHHEDSLYATHRTVTIVNVTSTSQGPKVTIAGLIGSQDLPTDPTINMENVDGREYRINSKGEHTTTAEWWAQVESRDRHLVA